MVWLYRISRKYPGWTPLATVTLRHWCVLWQQQSDHPISDVVHARVTKRICRVIWPRIVTHEIYAILLNPIVLFNSKRLGAMPANDQRLATQLIDLSPLTRIGAQICLKDSKSNSAIMFKGKTCGIGTIVVNISLNPQQPIATFNYILPYRIRLSSE